jgi:hypothetical protein
MLLINRLRYRKKPTIDEALAATRATIGREINKLLAERRQAADAAREEESE